MKPGSVPNPEERDAAARGGSDATEDDGSPGLPGFSSWGGVYGFVFVVFVLVVAGLAVFTHVFA